MFFRRKRRDDRTVLGDKIKVLQKALPEALTKAELADLLERTITRMERKIAEHPGVSDYFVVQQDACEQVLQMLNGERSFDSSVIDGLLEQMLHKDWGASSSEFYSRETRALVKLAKDFMAEHPADYSKGSEDAADYGHGR